MNRRGFTLFEIIVAIAIVMMLMSTMAETLKLAFEQKQSAEWAISNIRDIQTVGDVFVQEVACAVPPNILSSSTYDLTVTVDDSSTGITSEFGLGSGGTFGGINNMNNNGTAASGSYLFGPFLGDRISLSFYTTGSESKAAIQGGVRYIEFGLSAQPDNDLALVRRVDTNLLAETPPVNLPEEVLVTGVKSVQFQYFDGAGWADTWDTTGTTNNNTLPQAVRMILTLQPLRDNAPERVVTRVASILCAKKTINDYNAAANASYMTTGGIDQSGIIQGF